MNDLCLQHLTRQHRKIEQFLAAIEAVPENSKCVTEELARHLACHFAKESEILLPALETFLPADVGPLAVLREEHASLRSRLASLTETAGLLAEDQFQGHLNVRFRSDVCEIVRILRDQIYKEERVLFPMVARFLSANQDQELLRRMEAASCERRRE